MRSSGLGEARCAAAGHKAQQTAAIVAALFCGAYLFACGRGNGKPGAGSRGVERVEYAAGGESLVIEVLTDCTPTKTCTTSTISPGSKASSAGTRATVRSARSCCRAPARWACGDGTGSRRRHDQQRREPPPARPASRDNVVRVAVREGTAADVALNGVPLERSDDEAALAASPSGWTVTGGTIVAKSGRLDVGAVKELSIRLVNGTGAEPGPRGSR